MIDRFQKTDKEEDFKPFVGGGKTLRQKKNQPSSSVSYLSLYIKLNRTSKICKYNPKVMKSLKAIQIFRFHIDASMGK